jgi:CrcB protein
MADIPLWASVFLVFILGGLGALGRYGLGLFSQRATGHMRWGVLAANSLGSALAGYLLAIDGALGMLVAVGLLGSLTTFSSIAYTMAEDLNARRTLPALGLLASHTLLGLPAVTVGFLLGTLG